MIVAYDWTLNGALPYREPTENYDAYFSTDNLCVLKEIKDDFSNDKYVVRTSGSAARLDRTRRRHSDLLAVLYVYGRRNEALRPGSVQPHFTPRRSRQSPHLPDLFRGKRDPVKRRRLQCL